MKSLKFFFVLLLFTLSLSSLSAQQQRVVPGAFDLQYPDNGITINNWGEWDPWMWEISANATGYNFTLERLSPTAEVIFDETNIMPDCDEAYSYCFQGYDSASLAALTDGVYQWNVTALNGSDTFDSTSGPWQFTINSGAVLPSVFSLWYPGDKEIFNSPTDNSGVTWEYASNATSYNLVIKEGGSTTIIDHTGLTPAEDADGLLCGSDWGGCDYTFSQSELDLLKDGQSYDWQVWGVNSAGFTPTWDKRPHSFIIDSTAILPEWVEFWYPNDGQVFNSLADAGNWLWRNSINAIAYNVLIWRDNDAPLEVKGLTPVADSDALTCAYRMCTFTPPASFDGLDYYNLQITAISVDGFKNSGTSFYIDPNAVVPTKATAYHPPFGMVVTTGDNLAKFQWLASENTDTYNVWMQKLEPYEEFFNYWGDLTPADDEADNLVCTDGICTLTFGPGELPTDDGLYEWGLQSANDVTYIQASNHPLQMQFIVDSTGTELTKNGLMELDFDAVNNVPDGWVEKGTGKGDKKICNKDIDGDTIIDKYRAYTGNCAYTFKGNNTAVAGEQENNQLVQATEISDVVYDEIAVSGYIKTKNIAANKAKVVVLVFYSNASLGKDKLVYKVPNATQDWTGFVENMTLKGSAINKIKVKLQYKGIDIAGKVFFDNISVLGAKDSASTGLLPLPRAADVAPDLAPDSFRN